jgi:hypothetical protein
MAGCGSPGLRLRRTGSSPRPTASPPQAARPGPSCPQPNTRPTRGASRSSPRRNPPSIDSTGCASHDPAPAEALRPYRLPLEELGALADRRRHLAKSAACDGRGNEIVTYIVDRNVNYTNVCNVYCKFCAFYRVEGDADADVITYEEIDRKIEETVAQGGRQILLQGGHHPKLTRQWYLDLLAHMKARFPQVNLHGFSPSEFIHFREVFNEPLEKLIADFRAAGLGSIPGGGGEILADRVRQRVSPCAWRIGVQAAIRHAHPTKQSFHPAAESGSGSTVSELNGIRQSLDLDNPKTADKCLSRQNA